MIRYATLALASSICLGADTAVHDGTPISLGLVAMILSSVAVIVWKAASIVTEVRVSKARLKSGDEHFDRIDQALARIEQRLDDLPCTKFPQLPRPGERASGKAKEFPCR